MRKDTVYLGICYRLGVYDVTYLFLLRSMVLPYKYL
jgi:hypothetical protein